MISLGEEPDFVAHAVSLMAAWWKFQSYDEIKGRFGVLLLPNGFTFVPPSCWLSTIEWTN